MFYLPGLTKHLFLVQVTGLLTAILFITKTSQDNAGNLNMKKYSSEPVSVTNIHMKAKCLLLLLANY